jgi:anthrone oxygenase-like protein
LPEEMFLSLQAGMQILAILACGIFTGAAIYVNLVEHPARMSCGISVAVREWAPSYKRGAAMQAPLAVSGFVFAVTAWLTGAGSWWLVGGALLGLVVPFTLIVIMPTNKRLLATIRDTGSDETRHLLERWNRLHAVRSLLSATALVIFLLNF